LPEERATPSHEGVERAKAGRERASTSKRLRNAALLVTGILVVLWIIQIVNNALGYRLSATYGIHPHVLASLPYILTAPFLHWSWAHIEGNSVPLVTLGFLAAYRSLPKFAGVTAAAIVTSGMAAWLTGTTGPAVVGASGVIFGWFGYVIVRGFFDHRLSDILIGILTALYYLSIFTLLLPAPGLSYQDHIGGLAGGVLAGWLLRGRQAAETARDSQSTEGHKDSLAPESASAALDSHVEAELQALKREIQAGAHQSVRTQGNTQQPPAGPPQAEALLRVPPPPGPRYTFNPPAGWPAPPAGWVPPATPWDPGLSLPAAPADWRWWLPPHGHRDPSGTKITAATTSSKPPSAPGSRKEAARKRQVRVFGAVAAVAVVLVIAAQGLDSRAGQAVSSGGSVQAVVGARKLAACYGTDGYGNPQIMATADTLQQCAQFIEQLAEVVHPGLLPGGSAALGGTQCTMIAAHNSQEPFSVAVGQYGPRNLCSLLAGEGYGQL
jgi:membrane associated rhomboid family serine protease